MVKWWKLVTRRLLYPYEATYIYALIDPVTDQIRYIGKSVRPRWRFTNHLNDRSRTWRTNWLNTLRQRGLTPRMEILERVPIDEDWQEVEQQWIATGLAEGWPLTNCTNGGDGVSGLPPEVRERMRLTWLGRKHKPETLEKIGASSRQRRWTPERTELMRKKMEGRTFATEWLEKIRRSNQKLNAEQVTEIRCMLLVGVSQYVIADTFGVHQGTVYHIKRGQSYSDVGEFPVGWSW